MPATSLDNALKEKEGLVVAPPISGVITEVNAEEGERASPRTPQWSESSRRDSFELVASVDELDIADVAVGQRATVTVDARAGVSYPGTRRQVSATPARSITAWPVST
jgi:HlyD family secretion protein